MKKMICLDLDGTLLKSDKTIGSKTSKYLNQLDKDKYTIAIATGRHFDYARYLARDIVRDKYIIANNGAGIFNTCSKKTIYNSFLDESLVNELVSLSLKHSLEPIVYVNCLDEGFDLYSHITADNNFYIDNLVRSAKRIRKFDKKIKSNKALAFVIYGDFNKLVELEEYIIRLYKNEISSHIMTSNYDSFGILEIMGKGVNKWGGISYLAKDLGIAEKNTIAFGDEINDLEMIEKAGLGIAMKGSPSFLLEYADRETKFSNDQDGIYYELKEILKDDHGL